MASGTDTWCCVDADIGAYRYSINLNRPSGGTKDSALSRVHFCKLWTNDNASFTEAVPELRVATDRTQAWKEASTRVCEFESVSKRSGVPLHQRRKSMLHTAPWTGFHAHLITCSSHRSFPTHCSQKASHVCRISSASSQFIVRNAEDRELTC